VLEGVLSIDNALVLGLLAKRVPKHLQGRALTYGLVGALIFRMAAIGAATFLLKYTFFKLLGGAYLIYIAVKHFFFENEEEKKADDAPDERTLSKTGKPITAASLSFWYAVIVIELTDIAFAVDSIVAAIALVGQQRADDTGVHDKLWVVIVGGFIGVVVMRFAAILFIRLLEKSEIYIGYLWCCDRRNCWRTGINSKLHPIRWISITQPGIRIFCADDHLFCIGFCPSGKFRW
jgi:YkoY family integral membrane protein